MHCEKLYEINLLHAGVSSYDQPCTAMGYTKDDDSLYGIVGKRLHVSSSSARRKRNDYKCKRCKENSLTFSLHYLVILVKKGVVYMAQAVNVNFRLDEDVKKSMEQACVDMGLTMSAAFTIFAKKVGREKRIPFEVTADPFYSKSNIEHLEKIVAKINAGTASLVEHDLIEVDE